MTDFICWLDEKAEQIADLRDSLSNWIYIKFFKEKCMSFQKLIDAGVPATVITRAKDTSAPIGGIMEIINLILSVITGGGISLELIKKLLDLLFHFQHVQGMAGGKQVSADEAKEALGAAGVDQALLAEAEHAGVDINTIVTWITTLVNLVATNGPGILAAIKAILELFKTPIHPPIPSPPAPPISPAPAHFGATAEHHTPPKNQDPKPEHHHMAGEHHGHEKAEHHGNK